MEHLPVHHPRVLTWTDTVNVMFSHLLLSHPVSSPLTLSWYGIFFSLTRPHEEHWNFPSFNFVYLYLFKKWKCSLSTSFPFFFAVFLSFPFHLSSSLLSFFFLFLLSLSAILDLLYNIFDFWAQSFFISLFLPLTLSLVHDSLWLSPFLLFPLSFSYSFWLPLILSHLPN
jgi:hypothetical protein